MEKPQELINVLKNIKNKADSKIATNGTMVFLQSWSFDKAKEYCLNARVTINLSQLLLLNK